MKASNWITPACLVAVLVAILWTHYDRPAPDHVTTRVDGKTVGREYGPLLKQASGDAILTARKAHQGGSSVADIETAYKTAWTANLSASYAKAIKPALVRLIPDGTETVTPAEAAEVDQFLLDLAVELGAKNLDAPTPHGASGFWADHELMIFLTITGLIGLIVMGAVLMGIEALKLQQAKLQATPHITNPIPNPGASRS